MLKRAGYPSVTNLLGGVTAWEGLGLPMTAGAGPRSVTTTDVEGPRS